MTTIEIYGGESPIEGRVAHLLEGTSLAATHVYHRLEVLHDRAAAARAAVQGLAENDSAAAAAHAVAQSEVARLNEERQRLPFVNDLDAEGKPIRNPLPQGNGQVRHFDTAAPHITASAIAAATAVERRAAERRARTKGALDTAREQARIRMVPLNAARAALVGYKGEAFELAEVAQQPSGATAESVITVHQNTVSTIRNERRYIEALPLPAAQLKAKVRANLDDLADAGRLKVSKDGSILWPIGAGRFSSRPSENLNLRAMFVAANYDDLLIDLESAIDLAQEGVDEALTPAQKVARLAMVDAELDAAERAIAEAVWSAIEAGDDSIEFPTDLSGAAILGIVI